MLEFKNVSVRLPHGEKTSPISMMMSEGELTCLCGKSGAGKTTMLMAVMGLERVASGYITMDGEPVGPGSANYFRQFMAYVPQHLPDATMTVSELCETMVRLQVGEKNEWSKEKLMSLWQRLDIDPSLYNKHVNEVEGNDLKLVLLSILPLLHRRIVLIDDMPQTQKVYDFVRQMATEGAEVLYTCEENIVACDKIIKL